MKALKKFKQKTCEGCLPVCLLLLINEKITLESELELLTEGFKRSRESYALGVVCEFSSKYRKKVTIFVDNKIFFRKLLTNEPCIQLICQKIDSKFLSELQVPFILYLDSNVTGTYEHSPHFVIIEKRIKDKFLIIDPWKGKRRRLGVEKIEKGVVSLRNHLKFCPLVIKLN